jgi:hypothetical protein
MMTKVLGLVVAVGAMSGLCLAQTNTQRSSSQAPKDADKAVAAVDYTLPANSPLYLQRPQVEVPDGQNGWTLEIEITGGFVPSRKLITLTSRGRVTIDDSSGACSFDVEGGFPELDLLITEANEAGWGEDVAQPMQTEMCSDCRLKRLSVSGRNADGRPFGHGANWDDMTFSKLKKEVAAIYSAVEKIKRKCPETRGSDRD